jgi:hypothetical protein
MLLTAAMMLPLFINRWKEMDSDKNNQWYDFIVYRIKQDHGSPLFEIWIQDNCTKEKLYNNRITEEEYRLLEQEFNLVHFEYVNSVTYYTMYAHLCVQVDFINEIMSYMKNNFKPQHD